MSRRVALFCALAIAGSMLAVVPAVGSSHEDAVRLHLGTDGRRFSYDATTQALTLAKNGCQITSSEPLINLSSTNGGTSVPGLSGYSLGVKSSGSNSNGSPCGQVDPTERLIIEPGTDLVGRSFDALRLDVEMAGNAVVSVGLYQGANQVLPTYLLQTGTSITPDQADESDYDTSAPYIVSSDPTNDPDGKDACAAPNSSGPNNAGNDNCLWSIDPGFSFDKIVLTTTLGTVSLEGSGDFANDTEHDSLFYLANSGPDAVDDSATTDEDTSVQVDVLGNDTDVDGDTLTVSGVGDTGTVGTVTDNGDGTVSYDPNGQFENLGTDGSATDTFTYTISDGDGGTDTATVTVTITGVNDAPVDAGAQPSTPEDTSVEFVVATDVDSPTFGTECTSSQGGTFEYPPPPAPAGTVIYTPPQNFNGTDVITCTVNDGEAAEVTIEVSVGVTEANDAPVANADTAETDQDEAVTIAVLGNDTDVDLDTLSVADLSDPANGTATANADGTVTYEPDPGYTGQDTFTYKASDGTLLSVDPATVRVTVFDTICTDETVPFASTNELVNGTITKISGEDELICKRYTLEATEGDVGGTVSFLPTSDSPDPVKYRAYVEFGPEPRPIITNSSGSSFASFIEYDPLGGTNFRPVQWCINPSFDVNGDVLDASLPSGETWCIASSFTRGVTGEPAPGEVITRWQLFGQDDPTLKGGYK